MNEIIEAAPPAAPVVAPSTPADLMRIAIQSGGLDVDRMERLMAMEERWRAQQAQLAFNAALSAFQAEGVQVIKGKTVDFATSKGRTTYKHAELHHVVEAVTPALTKHGLSLRWHPRRDGARVVVKTILSHVAGHSEAIELDGGLDDSGNKNSLQQAGSTITYLQRYGALSILGLSTREQRDDDGGGPKTEPPLLDEGREHALDGSSALAAWWKALTKEQRHDLAAYLPALKEAAAQADDDAKG